MPANASWIHRAEAMTTVISTGKAVIAITVGRIEVVSVEVAAEAVVAMVSVEDVVEVAVGCGRGRGGDDFRGGGLIRFKNRDYIITRVPERTWYPSVWLSKQSCCVLLTMRRKLGSLFNIF
jgi:hypothetical protein